VKTGDSKGKQLPDLRASEEKKIQEKCIEEYKVEGSQSG